MSGPVVLVSPIPQYASASSSTISSIAARRHRSPSPIMVTLESEPPARSESVARTAPPNVDLALLSPPINTWKSRPQSRNEYRPRGRHRPTRSQSAPPTQTSFSAEQMSMEADVPVLDAGAADHPMSAGVGEHFNPNGYESQRRGRIPVRRNHTMFGAGYTHVSEGMTLRGGELVRPPPPLLRPTTFWRRAHRSGVAAASYSPAAHLIRRSTFIAAGLSLDAPIHDLSALCVESRITGEEGITRPSPRVVEIPQSFDDLLLV